jgi:hypothetical protein
MKFEYKIPGLGEQLADALEFALIKFKRQLEPEGGFSISEVALFGEFDAEMRRLTGIYTIETDRLIAELTKARVEEVLTRTEPLTITARDLFPSEVEGE